MKEQTDVFYNLATAPKKGARVRGNDSRGIINRITLLHTQTEITFEPVGKQ
jgi:glycine cleavage system regulatory protein